MKTFWITLLVTVSLIGRAGAAGGGPAIPPGEAGAKAALNASPRHGEWVSVAVPGSKVPFQCFVVYPEVQGKAPVVIVIHEIYGLTDWARAVADQLAAAGFLAIAPDLLSGKGPKGGGTDSVASRDDAVKLVRDLPPSAVMAALDAARAYALRLPSASGSSAVIGFCWGGGLSFQYAASQPALNAAVVYYGTNPSDPAVLAKIQAPVLGLYGADDSRVVATIGPAAEQMQKLGKPYLHDVYVGAGHGFLRAQDGRNGANLRAAQQAWPVTIDFLRQHLR